MEQDEMLVSRICISLKASPSGDTLEVPPSQCHCQRGKNKEAGMKSDSGLAVFSPLAAQSCGCPRPQYPHPAVCPGGTLLCIGGTAPSVPAPHSGGTAAYSLMRHHWGLLSAQSSWICSQLSSNQKKGGEGINAQMRKSNLVSIKNGVLL